MAAFNVDSFEWPGDLHWGTTPGRTLQNSRFLKYYIASPKQPTANQVSDALGHVGGKIDVSVFDALVGAAGGSEFHTVAGCAVQVWASSMPASDLSSSKPSPSPSKPPPVFKMVNRALIDDTDDLRHWCMFIRAVNCYLVNAANAPKKDVTCYRGSKMTRAQASGLTVGRILRPCMFFAMSTDKEVAKTFTGEAGYILELQVPAGCYNACPISHLAKHEVEKEVLMPPYSPILVKGHRQEGTYNIIEVEVLDGGVLAGFEGGTVNPGMGTAMSAAFRNPSRACVC
jgi:hypothetical protein